MQRSCVHSGGTIARAEGVRNICSWSQRAVVGGGCLKPTLPDVAVAAYHSGPSPHGFPHDVSTNQHQTTDVSCKAVLLEEREANVVSSTSSHGPSVERLQGPTFKDPCYMAPDAVDIAIIGADIVGLAAALATVRACPGARVMLYDTATGPSVALDGGALLSVNGLRALRSIDSDLYNRLTSKLTTSLHESLWYDMEGELVRRTQMGSPASGASLLSTTLASARRRAAPRRTATTATLTDAVTNSATGHDSNPDPTAPPLMVGLHELKEALMEALPPEVLIFGRHHLARMYPAPGGPGGGTLLLFAPTRGAEPLRAVRAQLVVVGADGASNPTPTINTSNTTSTFTSTSSPSPSPSPHSVGSRIVWRGRFALRPHDPDPAHLRRFTTASRTWVDLRAPPGSERQASVAPAGPHTYVWSASCPAELLATRGLGRQGGTGGADSPYRRCLAMFEDFPQDFFAALRATADTAVVEYDVPAVQNSAGTANPASGASAAASLAAPWRWFSGFTALVGGAVYPSKADDVNCTAINLALEDAAVLGYAVTQHGLTSRALAEYGRLRAPRVSAMLSLPPSAPERLIIRDAPFLPSLEISTAPSPPPAAAAAAPSDSTVQPAAVTSVTSDSSTSTSTNGAVSSLHFPLRTADDSEIDGKKLQPLIAVPAEAATTTTTTPNRPSDTQNAAPTSGPVHVPYTPDGSPSWVWSTLLCMSEEATTRRQDLEGSGGGTAAVATPESTANGSAAALHALPSPPPPPPSPLQHECASSAPVTQSFGNPNDLAAAAPGTTGDAPTNTPYDATGSPSRVWMGLLRDSSASAAMARMEGAPVLGAHPISSPSSSATDTTEATKRLEHRPPASSSALATAVINGSSSSTSSSSSTTAAAPGVFYRDPSQGLLPKPVKPRQSQVPLPMGPAAVSSPPPAFPVGADADADTVAVATVVATADSSPTPTRPPVATNNTSTSMQRSPRGSGGGSLRRRGINTQRGVHNDTVATTTKHNKPIKQRTAHGGIYGGVYGTSGGGGGGGGGGRTRGAVTAAASAAASQMTVSLSNEAGALGCVLSVRGVVDESKIHATEVSDLADVALNIHGGGAAVAQFWEDLNSLALSSAGSMSSLDLT